MMPNPLKVMVIAAVSMAAYIGIGQIRINEYKTTHNTSAITYLENCYDFPPSRELNRMTIQGTNGLFEFTDEKDETNISFAPGIDFLDDKLERVMAKNINGTDSFVYTSSEIDSTAYGQEVAKIFENANKTYNTLRLKIRSEKLSAQEEIRQANLQCAQVNKAYMQSLDSLMR
ncbi:hypothetical protein C4573_03540 [Candidatus Woesearchaeota archaeon]|nr:MAG: hypothetical protein C4573_03540 [Candidatus Woesearchaeota archaeon]